jgi:prohibitin 1
MKKWIVLLVALTTAGSCTIVRQGEVGVKRKLGRVDYKPLDQGPRFYNPFFTTIFKIPVNTINMEVQVPLPSREGLTISSEVSILYRLDKQEAPRIFDEIGLRYERTIILPVFRSAVADISARYYAKDMHSGTRSDIEEAIRERMMKVLGPKGFVIDNVLMKTIVLPSDLSRAIEEKLRAEQEAQPHVAEAAGIGEGRLGSHHGVGVGERVAEEVVEGLLDRVGEDQRAGHERHAERDRQPGRE